MNGDVIDFSAFESLATAKCKYCGLEYSKEIEDRLNESNSQKRLSDEVLKILCPVVSAVTLQSILRAKPIFING